MTHTWKMRIRVFWRHSHKYCSLSSQHQSQPSEILLEAMRWSSVERLLSINILSVVNTSLNNLDLSKLSLILIKLKQLVRLRAKWFAAILKQLKSVNIWFANSSIWFAILSYCSAA